MKAISYILLAVLTLSFVSCEKMDENENLMIQYYEQSLKLDAYSQKELQTFGDEFVSFVKSNPEVQSSTYFKPTWQNIKEAGYVCSITFYGDEDWEGEIDYGE